MKIEGLKIKNFRALYDVELKDIPPLAVFIGKNGCGKSTLFQVFAFLKSALQNNVSTALDLLGGYEEVVTCGHADEPIVIEIQFRTGITNKSRLVTYALEIGLGDHGSPIVNKEVLRYKSGRHGSPLQILDFRAGKGFAITNEKDLGKKVGESNKEYQTLVKPNTLAIKGVGKFQRQSPVNALRKFIENLHVSNFHIAAARQPAVAGVAKHLSETGDNLPLVVQHLRKNHPDAFNEILTRFREMVPGMEDVTIKNTEDGRVSLLFKDAAFKYPFSASSVSDGTIKMFAYLVLLLDPNPQPFLCIEEPEHKLYTDFFDLLVDELHLYANEGGQVFVSTHSPDILNYVEIEEAFFMDKKDGVTTTIAIANNGLITALFESGDQLGWLWKQDILPAFDIINIDAE